jgi:hypothetical protein
VALPQDINYTGISGWNNNNYSAVDFESMQDQGAVFLPAAGLRNGTSVGGVGSSGDYWSASSGSNGAYSQDFNGSQYGDGSRTYGFSVRLVRSAQ